MTPPSEKRCELCGGTREAPEDVAANFGITATNPPDIVTCPDPFHSPEADEHGYSRCSQCGLEDDIRRTTCLHCAGQMEPFPPEADEQERWTLVDAAPLATAQGPLIIATDGPPIGEKSKVEVVPASSSIPIEKVREDLAAAEKRVEEAEAERDVLIECVTNSERREERQQARAESAEAALKRIAVCDFATQTGMAGPTAPEIARAALGENP